MDVAAHHPVVALRARVRGRQLLELRDVTRRRRCRASGARSAASRACRSGGAALLTRWLRRPPCRAAHPRGASARAGSARRRRTGPRAAPAGAPRARCDAPTRGAPRTGPAASARTSPGSHRDCRGCTPGARRRAAAPAACAPPGCARRSSRSASRETQRIDDVADQHDGLGLDAAQELVQFPRPRAPEAQVDVRQKQGPARSCRRARVTVCHGPSLAPSLELQRPQRQASAGGVSVL